MNGIKNGYFFMDGTPVCRCEITKKKIKNIYISVKGDLLKVSLPLFCAQKDAERLIIAKKDFILRALKKEEQRKVPENSFLFLGKLYKTVYTPCKKTCFVLTEDTLYINAPTDCEQNTDLFYKEKAKEIIPPLFEKRSGETGLYPQKISFRRAKTRFGSCSAKGNISINYLLLKYPLPAIEYVVLHELCHLKYFNHSRNFYSFLEKHMPEYKKAAALLKSTALF